MFDRYTDQLQVFQLVADRYSALELSTPRVWMPGLEMGLGLWQGSYQGIERLWLRWYDAAGNWIPTRIEQIEQKNQRIEQLTAQLRDLGIEPNS